MVDTQNAVTFTWPDLPEAGEYHFAVRRWLVPRKWGGGLRVFWRDDVWPMAVNAEQHEKLKGWLRECAEISEATLEYYRSLWPDGFPEVDGKRTVPREVVLEWMGRIERSNRERGHKHGDFRWNLRERAAVYAVSTLKTRIVSGSGLRLPFVGELPPGLSIRISVGAQYMTRPSVSGGGWLALGDLGVVWVPPEKLEALAASGGLEKILYFEVSYYDRIWRLRPVLGETLTKEDAEQRKKAGKKRSEA